MNGAGNDFVVLDGRDPVPLPPGPLARILCGRRSGVGADGLLIVRPLAEGKVEVDYRNADGTEAGFCGNGARCAGRFAVEQGMAASPVNLCFPGVEVEVRWTSGPVEVAVPLPRLSSENLDIPDGRGGRFKGKLVHAGVPHGIWEDFPENPMDLPAFASLVFHARPDLQGKLNLTLVRPLAGDVLGVRTFERGSGETLACGSAALAAAAWAAPHPHEPFRLKVRPPSGIELEVRLDPAAERAFLTGPAIFVFRGDISPELLSQSSG